MEPGKKLVIPNFKKRYTKLKKNMHKCILDIFPFVHISRTKFREHGGGYPVQPDVWCGAGPGRHTTPGRRGRSQQR